MRWPYARVEFTSAGAVSDPAQLDAALALARGNEADPASDALLVAHGWNNTIESAEQLFSALCDNVADLADARGVTGHRWIVLGLCWPSVQWADDGGHIAGGGLSTADDLTALLDAIDVRVQDPAAAAELRALAGTLDASGAARAQFVQLLRTQLPAPPEVADDDPVPGALLAGDPEEVFDSAAAAEVAVQADDDGPAAAEPDDGQAQIPADDLPPGLAPDLLAGNADGTAAGFSLGDLSFAKLAHSLLDLTTYYTMKARAGQVGTNGVAQVLDRLAALPVPPRTHLIGHSFGARVVSAAAAATDTPVASVCLLQGAYSHHGLSGTTNPPGAFRRLLQAAELHGPIVVTHTHNDKAVLLAYAVASRLAGQKASGLGDADDPYGGLGANGAVQTAEADAGTLGDEHTDYTFSARRVTNLRADGFIHSHGDVTNRAVANAVLAAALSAAAVPAAAGSGG